MKNGEKIKTKRVNESSAKLLWSKNWHDEWRLKDTENKNQKLKGINEGKSLGDKQ